MIEEIHKIILCGWWLINDLRTSNKVEDELKLTASNERPKLNMVG